MRITLIAIPYKVQSRVVGWKGWRIHQWGFVWKEQCDCDAEKGCLLDEYEDEEPCNCSKRPPHTHTWLGYLGSRPIHFPKKGK